MLLSTFAMLALSSATPVAINTPAQAIGCHPQPGKVMGCVTNSHVVAQQRAMGTHQPALELAASDTVERTVACHPDPSRNRGCFRPAPAARVKPAMAIKAAPAVTAEADPAPTAIQAPDASRKSS